MHMPELQGKKDVIKLTHHCVGLEVIQFYNNKENVDKYENYRITRIVNEVHVEVNIIDHVYYTLIINIYHLIRN